MKVHVRKGRLFAPIVFLLLIVGIILAQFPELPKPPIDIIEKIPSLDKILKGEPPIQINVKDAVTGIPFLDDFDPQSLIPMTALSYTPGKGFLLERPGLYVHVVESYCLNAGAYGPNEEDAYLYAPIKGSRARIIQKVLQRTNLHPEIPQGDIQVLIWAITSSTKLSDMSEDKQKTAAKLLTAKELFELNGGALELVPKNERDKAFAKLPPHVRHTLEAEAQLREMLTKGQDSYEELEDVAVRTGVALPSEEQPHIPRGRWSFHPDGYFVRYLVYRYSETEIQLSVPEAFTIERDGLGRITLIADRNGNRIETEYNDAIEPLAIPGDPNVRGYAFRSIRFVQRREVLPEVVVDLEHTWKNIGWTLIGIPNGKDTIFFTDRFSNIIERYQWAVNHKRELRAIDRYLKPKEDIENVMDLAHYAIALKEVMRSEQTENMTWAVEQVNLVKKAWQRAFSERQDTYLWGCVSPPGVRYGQAKPDWLKDVFEPFLRIFAFARPGSEDKIPWFDPTGGAGAPANDKKQPTGQSNRQKGNEQDCSTINSELEQEEALLKAFQDPGLQKKAIDNNWTVDEYYDKVKENALGGKGSSPGDWESPMGTDPTNCEVQYNWGGSADATLQEYIRRFGAIAGPILFRAHQAHEQTHRQQCMDMGPSRFQSAGATIEGFSGFEQDAYKKGIEEKKKGKQELGCE